ncbi:nuclear transport factor 2 family protein [Kitasatospora sp. NPDC059646]|uniref:nuclear transport factor 2 family protein n=1 Tax=Kitasatospora sp. NPDC059646 TaxID=3346893 RepID=UPI0036A4C2C4
MVGGTVLERFVGAVNAKDRAGMADCLAEEVHHEEPALGWDLHGRDEVLATMETGLASVDSVMAVEEVIVAGDREVLAYRATATVLESLHGGWPAGTVGRTFVVRGVAVARIDEDGRIGHVVFHYDLAGILAQLGVLSVAA